MILEQRPAESNQTTLETEVAKDTEGETEFSQAFFKAQATEIILDRKFKMPGHTYTLTMTAFNMHDVRAENMVMKWQVLCANPVVPEDWFLDYPPYHYEGKVDHYH